MSSLISVDRLADLLAERPDDVVLVDVQWNLTGPPGRTAYERRHLPAAHFVDLDAELAGPPGDGGRHPMPATSAVQAVLRRCGVDAGSTVVVYDQQTSLSAARAWWVFRYFGVDGVRVLDGGLAAWEDADHPVTTDVPEPGEGTLEVHPGQMPLLDAEGAARRAGAGILLDSRAPERYAGETEPLDPVAGHIPGSVNAPMADYTTDDGTLLPEAELRTYFASRGVDGSRDVGTTCGSGVTAAHTALALHEIGVEAAVYVGSWSDWIRDPQRPVATGDAP